MEEYDVALMLLDEAIQTDSTNYNLFLTKAEIFKSLQEYQKSLDNLKSAERYCPTTVSYCEICISCRIRMMTPGVEFMKRCKR
jgi:tetratricopeptide (TPR) repeat protein